MTSPQTCNTLPLGEDRHGRSASSSSFVGDLPLSLADDDVLAIHSTVLFGPSVVGIFCCRLAADSLSSSRPHAESPQRLEAVLTMAGPDDTDVHRLRRDHFVGGFW